MSKCMQDIWVAFDTFKRNGGKAKIDNFWAVYENISLEQIAGSPEWKELRDELDAIGIRKEKHD